MNEELNALLRKLTDTEASRDDEFYNIREAVNEIFNNIIVFDLDGFHAVCPECGEVLTND